MELTKKQKDILLHSLGYDNADISYRNGFCTIKDNDDYKTCSELVSMGLMEEKNRNFDSYLFYVTPLGMNLAKEFVKLHKYIYIISDTNDADYIKDFIEITDDEIEKYRELILKIKSKKGSHNWPSSEYCDENVKDIYPEFEEEFLEEFEEKFNIFDIHSIVQIEIFEARMIEKMI